ncbi:MAG: metalloregulator ArsR/SmtB family transcription factor [Labilithrix sp.]|nr:metalloregulator ArsR/SmtB family transcription factor [Labilithrix sp.]MBX3223736.1 metalloregulator ArsR/SmtB family transcription factor [Labilithrix sp.]
MSLAHYVGTLNLLGDESRMRLCALLRERELRVTDLVRVTGISQSRVSTHLARLREGGFVRDRRDGQQAFYALALDTLPSTARAVLDEAASSSDPTLDGDRRRLEELQAEQRGRLPESFAGEMERHYSPGRTWQSLAVGLAALLRLGDVLDVGSGDGAAAGYLAPYCRSLTCIDTSARMIDAARARLARHENASARVADVHDLPFGAASFDSVVVFHTLTYAERPSRALDECARVLRPGGRLVLLSLDEHEQKDVTAPYGERHAGFSPRTLRGLLARAGLSVSFCDVVCREAKKPHFEVVLAVADKLPLRARSEGAGRTRTRTRSKTG